MCFKKFRWVLAALGLLMALPGPARDGTAKPKPAPPAPMIIKLGWLAGSWRQEKEGRVLDEQWMTPAGGVMLGMSRIVAKGRVQQYAFRQILEGPGGQLFYVLQLSGQPEAAYQSSSLTDADVVFENPEHDYPRKITYTLQADGSLLVALEGVGADGETKTAEITYEKSSGDKTNP